MEHLLAVFAVWLIWNLHVTLLTTPTWFAPVFAMVLGIGLECLVDPSFWWLGFGIAGAAGFAVVVSDLLMMLTDAIRHGVLARVGRRG